MTSKQTPNADRKPRHDKATGLSAEGFRVLERMQRAQTTKPKACPVCEDSACETKSVECGK